MQEYTINAQYTICVSLPKKTLKGDLAQAKGNCQHRVHSDHRDFGTVRRGLDLVRGSQRWSTKLAQGGPSGSSPLWSDGSHDSQVGGWTPCVRKGVSQDQVTASLCSEEFFLSTQYTELSPSLRKVKHGGRIRTVNTTHSAGPAGFHSS
jgi:hypothetical protein